MALRFSQSSVLFASASHHGTKADQHSSPNQTASEIAAGVAITEEYTSENDPETLEGFDDWRLAGGPLAPPPTMGPNQRLLTPSTPLKAFLAAKLRLMEGETAAATHNGQVAIVIVWLVELLLGEIGLLEERCCKPGAPVVRAEELASVRTEFRKLVGYPAFAVSLAFIRITRSQKIQLNT